MKQVPLRDVPMFHIHSVFLLHTAQQKRDARTQLGREPCRHFLGVVKMKCFQNFYPQNQNNTNMCAALVARELAACIGVDMSAMHAYYVARLAAGQTDRTLADTGVEFSKLVHAVEDAGIVPEAAWPLDLEQINRPPPNQLTPIKDTLFFHSVPATHIKTSDEQVGFVCEMNEPFKEFINDPSRFTNVFRGCMDSVPTSLEGHAMTIVDYDPNITEGGAYYCRSSWGGNFGACGNIFMPAYYIENPRRCEQFYVARTTSQWSLVRFLGL
jgi:hypothetical protein